MNTLTQTELQNEIDRRAKKAKSLSRKAYNGDGKFSATLDYCYTRIHQLRALLTNN